MHSVKVRRLERSCKKLSLIKNILLTTSKLLCENTSLTICSYLLLLSDRMKFNRNIWGFVIENTHLCIYLEGYRRYYCYSLSDEKLSIVNNTIKKQHSNWIYNEKNHQYFKENRKEFIYLDEHPYTIIISKKKKLAQQHPDLSNVFTCSNVPHQVCLFKHGKVFYSAGDFYIYSFDNEKKEYKLPFMIRSWQTWCVWKEFILYADNLHAKIYSFNIFTSVITKLDFQLKLEVTILFSWKNSIYVVDKKNNVYLYT